MRDLPACNTPKQCNWWGRDLFVDDPDLAKERLLFLNSGAFAFTSRRFFKPIGEQVYELYLKDRRFDPFGADQGFFNYVVAKRRLKLDLDVLNSSQAFVINADLGLKHCRPFIHFCWARRDDKPGQMARLLDLLADKP